MPKAAATRNEVPATRAKPKAPPLTPEEVLDEVEAVAVDLAAQGYRVDDVEADVATLDGRLAAVEDLLRRLVPIVKALRKAAPRG